jgi:hypothetical protein
MSDKLSREELRAWLNRPHPFVAKPECGTAECDCDTCKAGPDTAWCAWCACGWKLQGSEAAPTLGDACDELNGHRRTHKPWRGWYEPEFGEDLKITAHYLGEVSARTGPDPVVTDQKCNCEVCNAGR